MKITEARKALRHLVNAWFMGTDPVAKSRLEDMCLMAYWAGYQTAINDLNARADKLRGYFQKVDHRQKKGWGDEAIYKT